MDLFYGSTIEEQLKALKKDIKDYALRKYAYDYGNKRIYVAFGQKENIGNNILIVVPPFKHNEKPFDDENCRYLNSILNTYDIKKFFFTPCFLIPKEQVSKADIKDYSQWVNKLADILQPKLIVAMGEDSTLSFFRKKFILRDFHGKVIGQSSQQVDIILTYSPEYYKEKSEYEDPSYKRFVQNHDWTIISSRYKQLIKI